MNGTPVNIPSSDLAALSPAVALQLSVDSCARLFTLDHLDSDAISFLRQLQSNATDFHPLSLGSLFEHLWNPALELSFLFPEQRDSLPFSSDSISLLSVDALDRLFGEYCVYVDDENSLFQLIIGLDPDYHPLLRHVQWRQLNPDLLSLYAATACHFPEEPVWSGVSRLLPFFVPPTGFASLIISRFPKLFADFVGKRCGLLWRGSRDGFGGRDFHVRCDGHANTLTLIEDTQGNIFGGFTPVEWESREGNGPDRFKADPSLTSFLFTLRNPHNFPARKFALKAAEKDKAIRCDAGRGPIFRDIGVYDQCNVIETRSFTNTFGRSYDNDTGIDGRSFFTGHFKFIVKEIEVFEITNSTFQ
jgi:hypothetical protein